MSAKGFISQAIGGVLIVCGLVAAPAAEGQTPPPDTVDVVGLIRDFRQGHADFDLLPLGNIYTAGNVDVLLDAEGRPFYTGAGFQVFPLWRDSAFRPIAPHLYNTCNIYGKTEGDPDGATSFRLTVQERVKVYRSSEIDSFDSNLGPYGEENMGESALVRVNGGKKKTAVYVKRRSAIRGDVLLGPELDPERAVWVKHNSEITGEIGVLSEPVEMPVVEPPEMGEVDGGVEPSGKGKGKGKGRQERRRDVSYKGGTHSLSADLHCRRLKLRKGAVLNVYGDVTVLCEELEVKDRSEIRLMPGSTLTLYVSEEVEVEDESLINMNTGNPQLVRIRMLENHEKKSEVEVEDGSQVAAWVEGAQTVLKVEDRSEFFGSFIGRSVEVKHHSRFHVDMATAGVSGGDVTYDPQECDLGDIAGAASSSNGGNVASADTFAQWWRDIPGINVSGLHTFTFTQDAAGVYRFIDDDFRPIDGALFGNEGDIHNYFFTVEIDATFVHQQGAGHFFEYRGTDDAYLFINGVLVMDLGGLGFNRLQYVDLDRLGLPDGEPARLQFFHAQRQRGLAIFRIQTNVALGPGTVIPTVTGPQD